MSDLLTEDIVFEEVESDQAAPIRFIVERSVFQSLADKASSAVSSRDLVPVLKNFLVEAQDGVLRLSATDLELTAIAQTTQVEVEQPGRAAFPATSLLELLKEAPAGPVTVDIANGSATISAGRAVWHIRLADVADYPPLTDVAAIEFVELPRQSFIDSVRGVRYAASTETHRMHLMVVNVSNSKFLATDGTRLQQIQLPKGTIPCDFQIPILSVPDLLRVLSLSDSETFEFGEDEVSLVFRVDSDVFAVSKLNTEFPDIDSLLLKSAMGNKEKLIVNREALVKAIRRVRITADTATNGVVLHLTEDHLEVSAKDSSGNYAEEIVESEWAGKTRTLAFNHNHLLQLLQMSTTEKALLVFGPDTRTKLAPLLFINPEAGQVGLLTRLRLDWLA